MSRTDGRRRAYRLGLNAEWLAVQALRLKGYRILARRFKAPTGEIDIVARRGTVLAFVEVKARPTPDAARDALTGRQRARIAAAARAFLTSRPFGLPPENRRIVRFDLVLVQPGRWPRHIPGAWEIDSL
ncbi:MAG: YraN family protein [Alphaproteobacteria bacterium]|jgi:putative endonuclease|nr:YraN family protein [Alphaproteobacteria bacterium]